MKLGASLLFTIASAQQADNYDYGDYNLDGAAENTDYVPGDSTYTLALYTVTAFIIFV
jgi:hypothetical protein